MLTSPLGIDFGKARIGLATCPGGFISAPLKILDSKRRLWLELAEEIIGIAQQQGASRLQNALSLTASSAWNLNNIHNVFVQVLTDLWLACLSPAVETSISTGLTRCRLLYYIMSCTKTSPLPCLHSDTHLTPYMSCCTRLHANQTRHAAMHAGHAREHAP